MSYGKARRDNNASNIMARIALEQKAAYNTIYKPVEDKLRARLQDKNYVGNMANKAQGAATKAATVSKGIGARTRQRYGIVANGRQMQSINNAGNLSQARSMVGATNTGRQAGYAMQTQGMSALSGMGLQRASMASKQASAAAGMEAQRNAANAQAKAESDAGDMKLLGMGVGAVIAS